MNLPEDHAQLIALAQQAIRDTLTALDSQVRALVDLPYPSARYAGYGLATARVQVEDSLAKLSESIEE